MPLPPPGPGSRRPQIAVSTQPFITNAELLTLLRENIHDLVAIIDSQRRRVWFNDAYSATLGFTRAELESGDSTATLHPEDIQDVRARFEEALATGTGKRLEYRMRHKDGSWVWLESRSRVIPDVPNVGPCVVLVARDITQRKAREAEQLAHQRRLLAQKDALVALNRAPELQQDDVARITATVAAAARTTLQCEEVSVWWADGDVLRHQGGIRADGTWTLRDAPPGRADVPWSPGGRSSVLAIDVADADPLSRGWLADGRPTASLQVTLHRAGVAVGLLVCAAGHAHRTWHPDEGSFAESLGAVLLQNLEARERRLAFAALAESQRQLAAELADAAAYVQALLPPPHDVVPRADWVFIPSTQLGGDAFGYHWIDDDHFALYLLDVCGHGVSAALLSISALNVLRSASLPGIDFHAPAEVLAGLNRTFQMDRQNQMYFTLWYGVWNRQTRQLRCACAGHPPALLHEPGSPNPPARLGRPQLMVGALPEVAYREDATPIPPGATLLLFSDGVYEVTRPDGSLWSVEGFAERATRDGVTSGGPLDAAVEAARDVRGATLLEDDFSLVRFRF